MSLLPQPPTSAGRSRRAVLAAAAQSAAIAALAAPALPAVASSADAELIALCARYSTDRDAANASSDDLDPWHPGELWQAYYETHDAIGEARPQTLAGIVAKARTALDDAHEPDGTINFEGSSGQRWACDLVLDLVRLADAGVLS